MATKKLFYEDAHLQKFSAVVQSCRPGKHGFDVILNRTAFYPEGGGQPGDTGMLGGVRVTDTHEQGGEVVHYCAQPLEPGSTVEGTLDWTRRFDYMQQHSGEHLVSGLIHEKFGYENVGFHMGEDVVTIDFSGMLTMDELREIERLANEAVWRDLSVEVTYPDEQTLKTIPYRSKKELSGWVRIVTFPGVDICACCGTHVKTTGEIGLIKLLSCQKFHEGVRVELLCGRKALAYLNEIAEQNHQISVLLSAQERQTATGVQRLADELTTTKLRIAQLEQQSFARIADGLQGSGDCLVFEDGLTPDGVRRLTDAVMSRCGGMCAVFSGTEQDGYKYALGQTDGDLRALCKALNQQLHGRGGGKPFFVQGSVQACRAEIEQFWEGRQSL